MSNHSTYNPFHSERLLGTNGFCSEGRRPVNEFLAYQNIEGDIEVMATIGFVLAILAFIIGQQTKKEVAALKQEIENLKAQFGSKS